MNIWPQGSKKMFWKAAKFFAEPYFHKCFSGLPPNLEGHGTFQNQASWSISIAYEFPPSSPTLHGVWGNYNV